MKSTDIAWLAGLLDGEGCFHSNKQGSPTIRLAMTDRDVVERASILLGLHRRPTVRQSPPNKTVYICSLNVRRSAAWMMTLWPLLGERRRAAVSKALRAWLSQPKGGANCKRGHALTLRPDGKSRMCRRCNADRGRAIPAEVKRARERAWLAKPGNLERRREWSRLSKARRRAVLDTDERQALICM